MISSETKIMLKEHNESLHQLIHDNDNREIKNDIDSSIILFLCLP